MNVVYSGAVLPAMTLGSAINGAAFILHFA